MGCGSSGQVVAEDTSNGVKPTNGQAEHGHHDDDLPTMVLPDTPVMPKPPIAFEIPLDEFSSNPRVTTPPPHVQRLMQPPQADITLPDIEEKLAEAEQRRLAILQQRAASAQKKGQIRKSSFEDDMETLDSGREATDANKHTRNNLTISQEPAGGEIKNIT